MDSQEVGILSLSDYVLLDICEYLSPTDLWQLNRTCKRFYDVVRTKRLWRKIDGRDEPQSEEKVKFLLDRVEDFTEDIRLCATQNADMLLPADFPKGLPCTRLTVLALENLFINCQKYTLSYYPDTLVELSFRKTYINFYAKFFKFSNAQMKNLKVLILDHCFWLETNMLVQFSKYPALEILSMYNCRKVNDIDIAYISLAGCFGFKSLRILDVRFTSLGDQIIKSFYKIRPLTEIYFQNYMTTYDLEKAQRDLDIAHGAPKRNPSYQSPHDDVPVLDEDAFKDYFGQQHTYASVKFDNLTDDGPLSFSLLNPAATTYEVESLLYERPYGPCTCSKNKSNDAVPMLKNKGPSSKMKGARKAHIAKLEQRVQRERELMFNARSGHVIVHPPRVSPPADYTSPATPENPNLHWVPHRPPRNPFEMAILEHSDEVTLALSDPKQHCACETCARPTAIIFGRSTSARRAPPSNRDENNDDNNEDDEGSSWANVPANSGDGAADTSGSTAGTEPEMLGFEVRVRGVKRRNETAEGEEEVISNSEDDDDDGDDNDDDGDDVDDDNLEPESGDDVGTRGGPKRRKMEIRDLFEKVDVRISVNRNLSRPHGAEKMRSNLNALHILFGEVSHDADRIILGLGNTRYTSNISCLSFRGYRGVTNKTLVNVMYLNLKLLDVTYTGVTSKGLMEFASVNPKCRIIHEDMCTCRPKYHY